MLFLIFFDLLSLIYSCLLIKARSECLIISETLLKSLQGDTCTRMPPHTESFEIHKITLVKNVGKLKKCFLTKGSYNQALLIVSKQYLFPLLGAVLCLVDLITIFYLTLLPVTTGSTVSQFSQKLCKFFWKQCQLFCGFKVVLCLKAYSLNIQLAKFLALCFIRRLFILGVSFGFHGLPLLTFKTDRQDIRGLDLGKMTSFTHQLKVLL